MLNVFISYSHSDNILRKKFEEHLAPLKRLKQIDDSWTDRKISPGEKWLNKIAEAIEQADVFLLLISSSFINSDFCYNKEMNDAYNKHKEGTAIVIPIIIRDCVWQELPFADYQALLFNDKPIGKGDAAWTHVVKSLKKRIELFQDKRNKEKATVHFELNQHTDIQSAHPKFYYSLEAKADIDFPLFAKDDITQIIRDLSSRNWPKQSSAIDKIYELKWSNVSPDQIFVLGRNIYQCAVGEEKKALGIIKDIRKEMAEFSPEVAQHLINGMFYEIYFNKEGKFRGEELKSKLISYLFAIQTSNKYESCITFIRKELLPYSSNLIILPNTIPEKVVLNISVGKGTSPEINSITFMGHELINDYCDDDAIFFYSSQGFTRENFVNRMSYNLQIPSNQIEIICSSKITDETLLQLPEGKNIRLPLATEKSQPIAKEETEFGQIASTMQNSSSKSTIDKPLSPYMERDSELKEQDNFYKILKTASNENERDSIRAIALKRLEKYLLGERGFPFIEESLLFLHNFLNENGIVIEEFQKSRNLYFKNPTDINFYYFFMKQVRDYRKENLISEIENLFKKGFTQNKFSGNTFEHYDFSGFDYSRRNEKFSIEKVLFDHCKFYGSAFRGISFSDVSFDFCSIDSAKFDNCIFNNCKFTNITSLSYSFFEECKFIEAYFDNCFLTHTTFIDIDSSTIKFLNPRTNLCHYVTRKTS